MLYTASFEKNVAMEKIVQCEKTCSKLLHFSINAMPASPCVTEGHALFFILDLWVGNI